MNRFKCVAIFLLIASFTNLSRANGKFVPVSLAHVANQTHERIQDMPEGMQLLGGIPFELLPITGNNSWAAEVGTVSGVVSPRWMLLPVNVFGVTEVDTLINTSWGVNGSNTVSMTFTGSGGAIHTVSLVGGVDIRDWLEGNYTNTINGSSTIQVFQGPPNRPFGDIGRIDKQKILLPTEFAQQTLISIVLSDNGISGNDDVAYSQAIGAQRAFIYGVTVTAVPEPTAVFLLASACLTSIIIRRFYA